MAAEPVNIDLINDYRKFNINTDIIKDHGDTYELATVRLIVANNQYTGQLHAIATPAGVPPPVPPAVAGRIVAGPIQAAIKSDKDHIMNMMIKIPGVGAVYTVSPATYDNINRADQANLPEETLLRITGTPYEYTIHYVNRRNWGEEGEEGEEVREGIANIMRTSFIKYTDVHRGGNELLSAWPNAGIPDINGTIVRLFQALTRESEGDPASKFNPNVGNPSYRNKFYIENVGPGQNPTHFSYPAITEDTQDIPQTHAYLNSDFIIRILKVNEGKIEIESHCVIENQIVNVPKGANIAGALKKKVERVFGNLQGARRQLSTKVTYISKHMGDTAQLLSCLVPKQLTKVQPVIGGDISPINTNDENFARVFETYDTLPCVKALTEGIDAVWYYPTMNSDFMLIFRKTNNEPLEIRRQKLYNYMREEYIKLITEIDNTQASYVVIYNNKTRFIAAAKAWINAAVSYTDTLRRGLQIAACCPFFPSGDGVGAGVNNNLKRINIPEVVSIPAAGVDITNANILAAIPAVPPAPFTVQVINSILREIKNIRSTNLKIPERFLRNQVIFDGLGLNTAVIKEVKVENIITTTITPPAAAGGNKQARSRYEDILAKVDITRLFQDQVGVNNISGRITTRINQYWGLDVLKKVYSELSSFGDDTLRNTFLQRIFVIVNGDNNREATVRVCFGLVGVPPEQIVDAEAVVAAEVAAAAMPVEQGQGGGGKGRETRKQKGGRKALTVRDTIIPVGIKQVQNLKRSHNNMFSLTRKNNKKNINKLVVEIIPRQNLKEMSAVVTQEKVKESSEEFELSIIKNVLEDMILYYTYVKEMILTEEIESFSQVYIEFIEKMFGPRTTSGGGKVQTGGAYDIPDAGVEINDFINYPTVNIQINAGVAIVEHPGVAETNIFQLIDRFDLTADATFDYMAKRIKLAKNEVLRGQLRNAYTKTLEVQAAAQGAAAAGGGGGGAVRIQEDEFKHLAMILEQHDPDVLDAEALEQILLEFANADGSNFRKLEPELQYTLDLLAKLYNYAVPQPSPFFILNERQWRGLNTPPGVTIYREFTDESGQQIRFFRIDRTPEEVFQTVVGLQRETYFKLYILPRRMILGMRGDNENDRSEQSELLSNVRRDIYENAAREAAEEAEAAEAAAAEAPEAAAAEGPLTQLQQVSAAAAEAADKAFVGFRKRGRGGSRRKTRRSKQRKGCRSKTIQR